MATLDPKAPPKMPSAADIARIPQHVRDHALAMLRLSAAAREARKRWTNIRDCFKRWVADDTPWPMDRVTAGLGGRNIEDLTTELWRAELAQEQGAAVYRAQLAENDARPVGTRWSPTVLGLWARCMLAAETPA